MLDMNRGSLRSPEDLNTSAGGAGLKPKVITREDVDFSESTKVISSAQKFVIPVPEFKGEPLVYPAGHAQAGESIKDWRGNPIGENGIVFYNYKDQAYQAATAGDGIIIVNNVNAEQAASIKQVIDKFGGDPHSFTLGELKATLEVLAELGFQDRYNSNRTFFDSKLVPISGTEYKNADGAKISHYGHVAKNGDTLDAVYVPGVLQFQGPAATPQIFPDGAVLVREKIKEEVSVRGIQPDVFAATYCLADGSKLDPAKDLKKVAV